MSDAEQFEGAAKAFASRPKQEPAVTVAAPTTTVRSKSRLLFVAFDVAVFGV
jgi:hypothetical protein